MKINIMNMFRKYQIIIIISILSVLDVPIMDAQKKSSRPLFPESIECTVKPYFRHRTDGRPGREVLLKFSGSKFSGKGTVDIDCQGAIETVQLDVIEPIDSLSVQLPDGVAVNSASEVKFILRSGKREIKSIVTVPPKRQWTVYIYPHSHVDIGYTNTHENVELIHKRNLVYGIDLAKKTKDYPKDARYLWNPEVLWPVERYLRNATPEQKQSIVEAVQKGWLHLDAGYVHTNTTAAAEEELFEFFRECAAMKELTGKKIETLVQVDIPGMTWGIVPVASELGIKYCLAMNNGSDRVGLSTDFSFKPFWWQSPDGNSKILFFQPGSYNPGAVYKGFQYWPLMAGQTDTSKLLKIVKTDNPRAFFIDKYLEDKLPVLENSDYYPYDIFLMTWAMADNTPIDADLPDAVKSWNEDYAYPHLVIASATQMMQAFDLKYGDKLPVLSGDFTEYWTDGLGTAAKQTAMNRASKERLIQAETLWSMLNPADPAPRSEISEAWRNIIMGTEHTWCYMDPKRQPITNDILKVKFEFFQQGEDISKSVLERSLKNVTDEGSSEIGVFNTLSWSRGGLVYLTPGQAGKYNSVVDGRGKYVPAQKLTTGELVFMSSQIPSMGSKKYILKERKVKNVNGIAFGNVLDNGIVKVVIDQQTGDIKSFISGNYEFADNKSATLVNSYRYLHGEDRPEKATAAQNVRIAVKENGPLLATIQVTSEAEGCRSLTREITLIADRSHLEIKNTVDKIAVTEKEGIHFGFGFNIPSPKTMFDIPWGIVELEKDQLAAANRNWIAFQRWLDISNEERGVTFCSLDAPMFENGTLSANVLGAATNSPRWIRKLESSPTIYSWALNNHWHTNFPLNQEGVVSFRYRILPHNTKYDAASANRFGLEQAQPLIATNLKKDVITGQPFTVEGSSSIYVTIIKSGNGSEPSKIRLRSVSDKPESVTLVWKSLKPQSVKLNGAAVISEIIVPAKGFVTLDVVY
ncbi:MAG TPA: glycosyl hydrolase [Bacteroidales bacterium]|nr:glycosyl hydrolase [Bacteroidales bacterium]